MILYPHGHSQETNQASTSVLEPLLVYFQSWQPLHLSLHLSLQCLHFTSITQKLHPLWQPAAVQEVIEERVIREIIRWTVKIYWYCRRCSKLKPGRYVKAVLQLIVILWWMSLISRDVTGSMRIVEIYSQSDSHLVWTLIALIIL